MEDHHFPSLYPNPGWSNNEDLSEAIPLPEAILGKHCLLELYGCDHLKLNDEAFIRTIINTSAKIAGATLINLITHRFSPQGVTGLALLAESHISIHTWPEIGYGAVDVFTCGTNTSPEKACEIFIREFAAENHSLRSFHRNIPKLLLNAKRDPL